MLYNIYSVRDQGWERALIVCRPEDRGWPEGDFVKWLGATEADRFGNRLGFDEMDVTQRELKKIYPDMHPLGHDTIACYGHEYLHALQYCMTKDGDGEHDDPGLWCKWGQRQ